MKRWVARWLINAVALLLVASIVKGIEVHGVFGALLAAGVLGLVNAFIRPIFLLLTLPVTLLSFGLFVVVINAVMLLLTSALAPGFSVAGFWAALWGSILLSLVSGAIGWVIRDESA